MKRRAAGSFTVDCSARESCKRRKQQGGAHADATRQHAATNQTLEGEVEGSTGPYALSRTALHAHVFEWVLFAVDLRVHLLTLGSEY